ncbi:hypothetical protein ACLK1T_26955 [Escherichia coli]
MTNWPTLSGGVGDVDAGNVSSIHHWAKKEKLSTTTAKTGSVSRHQYANSLMPFATTAELVGLVRERPIDIHKNP